MASFKQTNSKEKIEALVQRIEETQNNIEESELVLRSTPEIEQYEAIELKNMRRQEAIDVAKQRIKEEYEE